MKIERSHPLRFGEIITYIRIFLIFFLKKKNALCKKCMACKNYLRENGIEIHEFRARFHW